MPAVGNLLCETNAENNSAQLKVDSSFVCKLHTFYYIVNQALQLKFTVICLCVVSPHYYYMYLQETLKYEFEPRALSIA